jgi:hypothetical protein
MPKSYKYTNVRYSLSADDHARLKRIQSHYEKKLKITKISQADVLRLMMRDIDALIDISRNYA